jgi:hypothetical protein
MNHVYKKTERWGRAPLNVSSEFKLRLRCAQEPSSLAALYYAKILLYHAKDPVPKIEVSLVVLFLDGIGAGSLACKSSAFNWYSAARDGVLILQMSCYKNNKKLLRHS